jgi:transposase
MLGEDLKGNRTLRAGLTPLAHAAARTKGASLSAMYHRLATRSGQKRATLAVAHVIVVIALYGLSRNEPYRELRADYVDEHRRHLLVDR